MRWSQTGGLGTLAANGTSAKLTATAVGAGKITVEAEHGGEKRSATAEVVVDDPLVPSVAKVVVEPAAFSGEVGEKVTLLAKAFDSKGLEFPGATFDWSVTGGAAKLGTTSGREVELSLVVKGTAEVTVTASGGGGNASARVPVTVKQPFAFPWDLLLLVLLIVAMVVAIAAALARRRKRRRVPASNDPAWPPRASDGTWAPGNGW